MTKTATAEPPLRPAFRDGQVLRADDLRAEAGAVVAAASRHQRLAHSPGIIAGLWLADKKVSPGMAIDGAGRTIHVADEEEYPVGDGEVWLAWNEEAERGRLAERYELLLETPGRYDTRRPDEHPLRAVYLGSSAQNDEQHRGRVYVGAVGARIVAPTGSARLLLGPDGPDDNRLFAVGTATDSPGEFRDHIAVDASGAIRFSDPLLIAAVAKSFAIVDLGIRPVAFHTEEILDARGLIAARRTIFKAAAILPAARLAAAVARQLNAVIAANDGGVLIAALRGDSKALRPETLRLKLAQDSPRANPHRLARLLLEDAFPDFLKRLPTVYDGPLGVTFSGTRPLPEAALPGCVYLAAADKAGARRELRFEIANPGQDNSPELYRAVVGTASKAKDPAVGSRFDPILTVDAAGTVTLAGDLKVFPSVGASSPNGLIATIEKPGSPDDPRGAAGALGLVSPLDLALRDVVPVRTATNRIAVAGSFLNTGEAAITHVQLIATVFSSGTKGQSVPLLRNLSLAAKEKIPFEKLTENGGPLEIIIPAPVDAATEVTLILSAYGHGPGFVIASTQLEFPTLKV